VIDVFPCLRGIEADRESDRDLERARHGQHARRRFGRRHGSSAPRKSSSADLGVVARLNDQNARAAKRLARFEGSVVVRP
jgi:hypothetical protein